MPGLVDELRSRWTDNLDQLPGAEKTRHAFERALGFVGVATAKKAELARPGTLSSKGLKRVLRSQLAATGLLAELREHRAAVDAEAAAIKADRESLNRPAIDRADLLAELQRQEMRSWLRQMAPGERYSILMTGDSRDVMEAALTAAPGLSGITADQRDNLARIYVERVHPEKLQELEARTEVNVLAGAACRAAVMDLEEGADFKNAHAFRSWLETDQDPEAEAA